MTPRRSFPPGLGWIPLTIAVIVAAVASVVAAVPQFTTKTVGTVAQSTTPGGPTGPQASLAPGASPIAGPNGQPIATGPGRQTGGSTGSQHTTTGGADCSKGQNDGATAPGVTANQIHIATTEVTTGVGAGFLGEAVSGMQAAIQQANNGGGVCGRRIVLDHLNDGWDRTTGGQDISGWINSNNYFALVGEPDSQGLSAAIDSGAIDQAGMPVVGSDGMLADQYFDPWVWPVAAATVTNMHVAVKYAYDHGARSFGIVFDQQYSFGKEGANAFDQEVKRLTGNDIAGYDPSGNGCNQAYCAISPSNNNYSSAINTFNAACKPCGMVMLLLEPGPAESWMTGEKSSGSQWYSKLMGGEPLFDDNLGNHCDTCGGMIVWTGYQPDIQPFDGSKAVYTYHQSLAAVCPSCDPHNEFTEGAYLGTQLFIEACRRVGPDLTRPALQNVLNSGLFDFGLSQPLRYGTATPREANASMAAFSDNFSGSFNGWNYMGTGFIADPARGQDFKSS